jgi:hypothetical protein
MENYDMNLVSGIMQMISPAIIDKIASSLGINSTIARTAITYALPAILGGFATKAATPTGARDLYNAVSSADTGLFSNMDKVMGGAGKDALISNGTSMLNNLLGSGTVNNITSALSKNTGIGAGAAAMLLPLAGQMALSGIAKAAPGVDASGLATLLSSQQANLRAAMPGTPNMDTSRTGNAPVQEPARAAGGFGKWVIPVVVAAGALWYFLQQGKLPETPVATEQTTTAPATTTEATPAAPAATTEATPAAPAAPAATTEATPAVPAAPAATTEATPAVPGGALVVDGVDVGQTLTKTMGDLQTTLSGVTDVATATAAVPKLQEQAQALEGLAGSAGKLGMMQKTALGAMINTALPPLRAAADKVTAMPGVGDVIKPVIDGIFVKIEALAK